MPVMLTLGPVTFLAPLALLGLLTLPLIWWLLRVTPPAPKRQIFPPLRILQDVVTEEETPNSTPIWLLLFRLLMVALVALALARPILFQAEGVDDRPLTLLIDDSWDGAANWTNIVREAEARISDARRKNVDVLLLTSTDDNDAAVFGPATDAMRMIKSLRPSPLPANHAGLAARLQGLDISGSDVKWLSGGVAYPGTQALAEAMSEANSVERLAPTSDTLPLIPGLVAESGDGFRSVWHRPDGRSLRVEEVTAHGRDGTVMARADLTFAPGLTEAEAAFELPSELRNRITALRITGVQSAGSVKLLDDSWGRPLIGILTPDRDNGSPLLSEPFYARTALTPYGDIFTGSLDELLPLAPSVIIMPDVARTDAESLKEWVETGGLLIRFAGPRLAKRADDLLPVILREGGRELGGALTWEDPQKLATFSEDSPFFGLKVSDEIAIKRQVMAEPSAMTDSRTWARLEDGSPIVTSAQQGFGRIVLFHVTAGPEWSNLAVGGLYVDMLRRLLGLARATPGQNTQGSGDWAPERVLNGFGRLEAPGIETRPIAYEAFDQTDISATHPPGLYRQGARRKALNTVKKPDMVKSIGSLPGVETSSYGQTQQRTLGGLILGLVLFMLALDALFALIVTGRLSNLKPRRILPGLALLMSVGLVMPHQAEAQDTADVADAALELHLAYIETGDARRDDMSLAAMEGLAAALNRRTTIEPVGVHGVDPAVDPLVFYPFLYWPVARDAPEPSDKAIEALNSYMASGGTLVLDTQDAGDQAFLGDLTHPGLARVTAKLDVPSLEQVPEDHVLTKSFYLLQVFPGRWANGAVWVDRDNNGTARDGVSSVIISGNDWAAGWAMTKDGEPLAKLERDIPNQREMSLRFGVNLAMYALAGNYKSDQVHAAVLIERLGRGTRQMENLGDDREDRP